MSSKQRISVSLVSLRLQSSSWQLDVASRMSSAKYRIVFLTIAVARLLPHGYWVLAAQEGVSTPASLRPASSLARCYSTSVPLLQEQDAPYCNSYQSPPDMHHAGQSRSVVPTFSRADWRVQYHRKHVGRAVPEPKTKQKKAHHRSK
jgi:hypothetical protein